MPNNWYVSLKTGHCSPIDLKLDLGLAVCSIFYVLTCPPKASSGAAGIRGSFSSSEEDLAAVVLVPAAVGPRKRKL